MDRTVDTGLGSEATVTTRAAISHHETEFVIDIVHSYIKSKTTVFLGLTRTRKSPPLPSREPIYARVYTCLSEGGEFGIFPTSNKESPVGRGKCMRRATGASEARAGTLLCRALKKIWVFVMDEQCFCEM